MLFAISFCLIAVTLAQSSPFLTDPINGMDLQLPRPPPGFDILPQDVDEPYSVPVAQASHLLLTIMIEVWESDNPRTPTKSSTIIDDSVFKWTFQILVRRDYASQFGNLITIAWTVLRILEIQLSYMELYQDQWKLPSHGYKIKGSATFILGTCHIDPIYSLDQKAAAQSSLTSRDRAGNVTTIRNETSPANIVYDLDLRFNGPVLPKQAVLWLLWRFLDRVLAERAKEKISRVRRPGDCFSSSEFKHVQLNVTFNRVRDTRYDIRWIDIALSVAALFQKLDTVSRWRRFHADVALGGSSNNFLSFDI